MVNISLSMLFRNLAQEQFEVLLSSFEAGGSKSDFSVYLRNPFQIFVNNASFYLNSYDEYLLIHTCGPTCGHFGPYF